MENLLRVSLVQTSLYWESPEANRASLEEKISDLHTDLIVLPEMFTTGFSMNATTFAEPMNLTTCKWLQLQAKRTQAVVTGSCIIGEQGKFYNRLLWVEPSGEISFYDKKHLFRLAGEGKIYTAGSQKLIKKLKNWHICPLICYDLRFPIWSRNQHLEYDMLLYVANWPNPRLHAWDVLLQARAIENLAYSVGVNRVGVDASGHIYDGNTALYDFRGETLLKADSQKEQILQITLDKKALEDFREKFPVYLDADK